MTAESPASQMHIGLRARPKLIAIIGAESTGKTTLARALADEFSCPMVPEYLREFCDEHGRTPKVAEQALILETQLIHERAAQVEASLHQAAFVFCDTAPLLTAIYSDYVFADTSLYPRARALHPRYALTLLTEPDIAWVADGLQREGAHVRASISRMIERELGALSTPWTRVTGHGAARVQGALRALSALSCKAEK